LFHTPLPVIASLTNGAVRPERPAGRRRIEGAERLEGPRMVFDHCPAFELAQQRGDAATEFPRVGSKLSKLPCGPFAAKDRQKPDDTNHQMAARSLTGCVAESEVVFAAAEGRAGGGAARGEAGD
jgi:hypothetical protein